MTALAQALWRPKLDAAVGGLLLAGRRAVCLSALQKVAREAPLLDEPHKDVPARLIVRRQV